MCTESSPRSVVPDDTAIVELLRKREFLDGAMLRRVEEALARDTKGDLALLIYAALCVHRTIDENVRLRGIITLALDPKDTRPDQRAESDNEPEI